MDRMRSLLRKHGTPSCVFDREGTRTNMQLAEIVKSLLWTKASAMVDRFKTRPLLYSYSADSTTVVCQSIAVCGGKTGRLLRRTGKLRAEFLLQRGVLVAKDLDDKAVVEHLIMDPLLMKHGKSAAHVFSAFLEFRDHPRTSGHRGIVILHGAFDRALLEPMIRYMRGRQELYYDEQASAEEGGRASVRLLQLTDWVVGTGCALHDAHNSLKWAVSKWYTRQSLKDYHVVTASLRDSFAWVVGELPGFLSSTVEFVEMEDAASDVAAFWSCLGIDSNWLELFCDLNMTWDAEKGRLLVNARITEDSDMLELMTSAVLYLLRSETFVEGRFLGIGRVCRMISAGVQCGIGGLMKYTLKAPGINSYYLQGYSKLSNELILFSVITGTAAWVPEAVLQFLFDDDRVGLRLPEIKTAYEEEVAWLEQVSSYVWRRLAAMVPGGLTSWQMLRSEVLFAAHRSVGYMKEKFVYPAEQLPWTLTRGDKERNLEELKALPKEAVTDPVARKIHTLARKEYNPHELLEALELLGEIPWSTKAVEQGHGSAAVVRRVHSECGPESVASRAMLHQCRGLFGEQKESGRVAQLLKLEAAVARKRPSAMHGQNIFLQNLLEVAKRARVGIGSTVDPAEMRTAFRMAPRLYSQLPPRVRARYDQRASVLAAEEGEARRVELDRIAEEIRVIRLQEGEEPECGPYLFNTTTARLTATDFEHLAAMMEEDRFRPSKVEARRADILAPPMGAAPAVLELLEAKNTGVMGAEERTIPYWLRIIALQREELERGIVFSSRTASSGVFYLVLYALQRPYLVSFLRVYETAPQWRHDTVSHAALLDVGVARGAREFTYTVGDTFSDAKVDFAADEELHVMPRAVFLQEGRVGSHGVSELLKNFTAAEPVTTTTAAPAKKPRLSEKKQKALDENPHLAVWLEKPKKDSGAAASSSGKDQPKPAKQLGDEGKGGVLQDEELMHWCWDELAEEQAELAEVAPSGDLPFYIFCRGGYWTKKHKHVVVDAIAAKARAGCPLEFTKLYQLNRMFSMSTKLYTKHEATTACVEWCARMKHYYDIYMAQDELSYRFSNDELESFVSTEPFCDVFIAAPLSGKLIERLQQVHHLRPRLLTASSSAA